MRKPKNMVRIHVGQPLCFKKYHRTLLFPRKCRQHRFRFRDKYFRRAPALGVWARRLFQGGQQRNAGGEFYSQAGQFYYVRGQGRMDTLEDIGIGFLALFGVSVQTAVVYISYVNELRLGGTKLAVAIHEGAILRLRPIMMTALVAALGLLPTALATGVGTDTQRPFALVIVSGLFTRLLISIFLMTALYTLVARPDDRLEV